MISKRSAPHNTWGDGCDGWTLTSNGDLHVMQERMPAGAREVRHLHTQVRQFYFVLEGVASVGFDGRSDTLVRGEGVDVPPGVPHQLRNDSDAPLEFLVVSSSPPREDRTNLDESAHVRR